MCIYKLKGVCICVYRQARFSERKDRELRGKFMEKRMGKKIRERLSCLRTS